MTCLHRILKLIRSYALTQALCLQKKITIDMKMLISVHEIHKDVINFNLKLKKLVVMFLLQNKQNVTFIFRNRIKSKSRNLIWLINECMNNFYYYCFCGSVIKYCLIKPKLLI